MPLHKAVLWFVSYGKDFRQGIDAVLGEGACHVLSIRPQGGVEAFCQEGN